MHIQPPKKKNKHKHKQSRTQDPVPPGRTLPCRPYALLTLHHTHPTSASCRNPLGLRPQEKEEEERGGSRAEKEEEGKKEKKGRLGAGVLLHSACPSPVPGCSWAAPMHLAPAVLGTTAVSQGLMPILLLQNRHSPEHPGVGSSQASSSSSLR